VRRLLRSRPGDPALLARVAELEKHQQCWWAQAGALKQLRENDLDANEAIVIMDFTTLTLSPSEGQLVRCAVRLGRGC
jgi:hypothetical protein